MVYSFRILFLWFVILSAIISTSFAGRSWGKATSRWMSRAKQPRAKQLITMHLDKRDHGYYGEISLGSPIQTIKVLIDTGSSYLIIVSPENQGEKDMGISAFYHHEQSETFKYYEPKKTLDNEKKDGAVFKGLMATEVVAVGEPGSEIEAQVPMAIATTVESYIGEPGALGLTFNTKGFEPPLLCLTSKNGLPAQFSIYLKRPTDREANCDDCGKLHIGGYNSDFMASEFHTTVSVIKDKTGSYSEWGFYIDWIGIGGEAIPPQTNDQHKNGILAIPDTGTSSIVLPKTIYDPLLERFLNGFHPKPFGQWFHCYELLESLPNIQFKVKDGPILEIGPEDYISMQESGYCRFKIRTLEKNGKDVVLGSVFFHKYYTMFDFERKEIKFAEAKQDKVPAKQLQPGKTGRESWGGQTSEDA